jgi:hypothetical protein
VGQTSVHFIIGHSLFDIGYSISALLHCRVSGCGVLTYLNMQNDGPEAVPLWKRLVIERSSKSVLLRADITAIVVMVALLSLVISVQADWREDLARMPLVGNPSALDETNCVPLMLQAFHGGKSVKALIFMPGATDELYFFHRVHVRLQNSNPRLSDAVAALTNHTSIHATWRVPFLILHTDEDTLDPIGVVTDAPTAQRIKAARLASETRFDDRDWGTLQPFLVKTLGIHVEPSSNSLQSYHFFRHSLAAFDLTGWELIEATSLAGKTKFRVEPNRVVFEGDTRHITPH